jgi:hypothetical protein
LTKTFRYCFPIKIKNFRRGGNLPSFGAADYHSANGGLSFCKADYHSRNARLTP